jgi:hypothetical protein
MLGYAGVRATIVRFTLLNKRDHAVHTPPPWERWPPEGLPPTASSGA